MQAQACTPKHMRILGIDPGLQITGYGIIDCDNPLRPQLIGYYARTSEGSPKDPRWFIVLARLQTQFGDYGAAIDA